LSDASRIGHVAVAPRFDSWDMDAGAVNLGGAPM
jgi:hypothetical protein